MDYNVLDALAQITREKNVGRKIVIESLIAGLQSAAKKKVGAEAIIEAHVDELAALVDRSAEAVLVVPLGPVQGGWPQHHLHAMWAARRAGVATINGYTGNRPPGWDFGDLRIPRGEGLDEVRRRLDSWAGTMGLDPARVQILVVGGTRVQPEP